MSDNSEVAMIIVHVGTNDISNRSSEGLFLEFQNLVRFKRQQKEWCDFRNFM